MQVTARRERHGTRCAWLWAGVVVACTGGAHAGAIGGFSSPAGTLSRTPLLALLEPINNDDDDLPDNLARYDLRFTEPVSRDVLLQIDNSGGVSEFRVNSRMTNATMFAWHGIIMELGFGTGENFVPVTLPGLDFDTDPNPLKDRTTPLQAAGWSPVEHGDRRVVWSYDLLPISLTTASMIIDFPDADPTFIPESSLTGNGYLLTIRQTPVIPEPGAGVLLLVGLAVSLRRRR